ncbi:T9SS type A sorting domain-containing protein [Hymenobacter terricola]|uniref:T9SS type A sorting domain-containing protein n=1 Tax=Hymenobacter terricola TaxID=2819236 RepID=UPI001B309F2D|nr:T9SS type A sorting domain-containing protein [Hymenobacter terricola]
MKKTLLATIFALGALASHPAAAQYYILPNLQAGQNPGALNLDDEARHDVAVAPWNLILTGTNATQAAADWSPVQTLPFGFQMNGQTFTSYKVSSSGVLTFSTGAAVAPATVNRVLPDAAIPDNSVCLWGTIMTSNNDFIVTKTFGTAPNRQHWVQFNSISIPGGNTNVAYSNGFIYLSIVLEESTNKVYTVWQRSGVEPQTLTVGIQLNSTQAVQVAASPTVTVPNLADLTPADNGYYEFGPGTQAVRDIAGRALRLPHTAAKQSSVAIQGAFQNLGTQAVTTLTANYRVNNGPVVSAPLTGYNVAYLDTAAFVHPTPWVPTTGGVHRVRAWFSNINGGLDQNPANDTLRTTVVVADSTMQRTVVEEDFTSSTCGPCRLGNANTRALNTQSAQRNKFVEIKYQQNFPAPGNDPYYTAESGARFGYYSGSYIPYMLLDGGWNENSQSYTIGILDQFRAKPAMARVSGSYTLRNNVVAATASVKPLLPIPAGRLVAHMVVVERETQLNARTNGETRFFDVMKKMLPNQNGTVLPALASGQAYSLTQTFDVSTLPTTQSVEHFDSLRVVVFVQDLVTKEVYQGGYLTLRNPLATRTSQNGPAFALAPNPTSGRTTLFVNLTTTQQVRVEVLDVVGRRVYNRPAQTVAAGAQELTLDLGQRPAGLYTVRLSSTQGVRTQKLTLE